MCRQLASISIQLQSPYSTLQTHCQARDHFHHCYCVRTIAMRREAFEVWSIPSALLVIQLGLNHRLTSSTFAVHQLRAIPLQSDSVCVGRHARPLSDTNPFSHWVESRGF